MTEDSSSTTQETGKSATLYRMVMDEHVCPYGIKARHLLERHEFDVDDRWLRSRSETDEFKKKHGVDTTPQVFIGDRRIGGYDDLRKHLGLAVSEEGDETYRPVLAIFGTALGMAIALSWAFYGDLLTVRAGEWFIAISMCLLGLQKLRDVESFSTMFLNYDLLGRRWVPYSYFYPYAETGAGVLMVAGALPWLSAPVAFFIGTAGAVSVFKAVYVDKRELKCACVGGGSQVPLGFVSLTENLMMIAIAIWTLGRAV